MFQDFSVSIIPSELAKYSEGKDFNLQKKALSDKYIYQPRMIKKGEKWILVRDCNANPESIKRFFTPEFVLSEENNQDIKASSNREKKFFKLQQTSNYNDIECLKFQFPSTKEEWLNSASSKVSASNPILTLLLDLDKAVLHLGEEYERFKFEVQIADRTFFIDENAFKELKRFQHRGHHIIVITAASYTYDEISTLFRRFDITLEEERYVNRRDLFIFGKSKSHFIDMLEFHEESLLIDDKPFNKPTNCHFIQVSPESDFPKLSKIID